MVKNNKSLNDRTKDSFNKFIQAQSCTHTFSEFLNLCNIVDINYPPNAANKEHSSFYPRFKKKLSCSWKAENLFSKLDKRFCGKEYNGNSNVGHSKNRKAGENFKVLIVGAGPCGLRTAVEMACLGTKVILLEKRDDFSRNNILHLWPFLITDLKTLGAKKIYGRFCAGAIDHISIRQLQLILLKVSLMLGVEIIFNVSFDSLIPPAVDDNQLIEDAKKGWTAALSGSNMSLPNFEFDVVVGADGKRNTLEGFNRKEFRAKLAIGLTVNFINHKSDADAKVEEMSGVASIYNPTFFQNLHKSTGIDLENIVYYKGDTHYFVMTAKKHSLLMKGVIKQDFDDTASLLHRDNIDSEALMEYTKEAARFSTKNQLPNLEFALNHSGSPDVALFDFTCMYGAENAALFREENGRKLLTCLVGDSLLEPFWPEGTGCARGFLAAFDLAWMVRRWALNRHNNSPTDISTELNVLAERQSIYRRLRNTKPSDMKKKFSNYTIDPTTRYQNIDLKLIKPQEMTRYYLCDREINKNVEANQTSRPNSLLLSHTAQPRKVSLIKTDKLLSWCEEVTEGYDDVTIDNFSSSWKDGRALCAIIHRFQPDLIHFDSLATNDVETNNQLAFDVAEEILGIPPVMTGQEMAECDEVDKLTMLSYISQFYEIFKNRPLSDEDKTTQNSSTPAEGGHTPADPHKLNVTSPIGFLTRLSLNLKHKAKALRHETKVRASKEDKEEGFDEVEIKTVSPQQQATLEVVKEESVDHTMVVDGTAVKLRSKNPNESPNPANKRTSDRISCLSDQLVSLFNKNAPNAVTEPTKRQVNIEDIPLPLSSKCYFCARKLHVLERLSAEGVFFHRQCFVCSNCNLTLRVGAYLYDEDADKFFCDEVCQNDVMMLDEVDGVSGSPALDPPKNSDLPKDKAELYRTPERIELEDFRLALANDLEVWTEEDVVRHNMGGTWRSEFTDSPDESVRDSSSSDDESEDDDIDSLDDDDLCDSPAGITTDTSDTSSAEGGFAFDESPEEEIFSSEVVEMNQGTYKRLTSNQETFDDISETEGTHDHEEKQSYDAVDKRLESIKETEVDDKPSNDDDNADAIDDSEDVSDDKVDAIDDNEDVSDAEPIQSDDISSCIGSVDSSHVTEVNEALREVESDVSKPRSDDETPDDQSHSINTPPLSSTDQFNNDDSKQDSDSTSEISSQTSKKRCLPSLAQIIPEATDDSDFLEEKQMQAKKQIEKLKERSFKKSVRSERKVKKDRDGETKRTLPKLPVDEVLEDSDIRDQNNSRKRRTLPEVPNVPRKLESFSDGLQPRKKRLAIKLSRAAKKSEQATRRYERLEAQKRLVSAQTLQRQLEEIEVQQRSLEERGAELETILRSCKSGEEDPDSMQEWFKLVQEKNTLLRCEYQLMIQKRQLQLDEERSRLERELRKFRSLNAKESRKSQLYGEEVNLLMQIVSVVEQSDELQNTLEEQNYKPEYNEVDIDTIISGNLASFQKQEIAISTTSDC